MPQPLALGQLAALPLQLAPEGSQTVLADKNRLGQLAVAPSQRPGNPHGPCGDWQSVPAASSGPIGQTLELPVQLALLRQCDRSCARHTVLGGSSGLGGQAGPLPGQLAGRSQPWPNATRHCVPAATKPSGGQSCAVPLHDSVTSQMSTEGRHTALARCVERDVALAAQVPLVVLLQAAQLPH